MAKNKPGDPPPNKAKRRKTKQRIKAKYQKARETAQLHGVIETTPEGAVRNEAVDPTSQGEQAMTPLVRQAIRKGWAVPEDVKPALVDELIGVVQDPEASNLDKISSFNALSKADRDQWQRDNPTEAGKAKGGIEVTQTINLKELFRAADEARKCEAIREKTEPQPQTQTITAEPVSQ